MHAPAKRFKEFDMSAQGLLYLGPDRPECLGCNQGAVGEVLRRSMCGIYSSNLTEEFL